MRLGLDLLFLIPGESGGRETYARELIGAMLAEQPGLEATAFVNREADGRFARDLGQAMSVVRLPVSARHPAQWSLGELVSLPLAGARAQVDVMHSLANFGPAGGPFRRVLTVHDLQYRAVPELLSPVRRAGTAVQVALATRQAHRIIAVSAFARDELVRELSIAPGRIDVIPNGFGTPRGVTPVSERDLREGYGLGQGPVVLAVGTNLPHKNLPRLLEALGLIDQAERPVLVLAGGATEAPELAAQAAQAGVGADVRRLGYQPPEVLEGLYRLATCLVVPTLYEGFGLPVLEAMARDLPVICSDIPALREVAGDAALYFSPTRPAEMAAVLQRLLGSPELAHRLAEAGRAQVARFSWSRAAQDTLSVYRRALSGGAAEARAGPRGRRGSR
jgi:glycosyltransferase involved in cell wall biosynthesis